MKVYLLGVAQAVSLYVIEGLFYTQANSLRYEFDYPARSEVAIF